MYRYGKCVSTCFQTMHIYQLRSKGSLGRLRFLRNKNLENKAIDKIGLSFSGLNSQFGEFKPENLCKLQHLFTFE